jgi:IS5 family transposase
MDIKFLQSKTSVDWAQRRDKNAVARPVPNGAGQSDRSKARAGSAGLINWQAFSDEWSPQFASPTGRPALPTRLMAALLYLKHVYALSDEDVVARWCENPYWQHFSGEQYFRHELPCDPSSLVRWRQRIGEAGCEWLLAQTIEVARSAGVVKRRSLDEVGLDTTVQPKAIAHPMDSRLHTAKANCPGAPGS